jgi:3D (Asp-Asp-Asp) domain-containing protein
VTDPRIVAAPIAARKSKRAVAWLLAAGAFMIVVAPVVLFAGAGNPPCQAAIAAPPLPTGSGPWIATAYGPPWDAMNGSGVTATGLNLTAGEPAYEIATDPSVIALGSFDRVTPNPFDTSHAFYAGDTGGAIIGRHVDIYDWQGRAAQDAWGVRHVTVTPAANPGTGNLLGEITPSAPAQAAAGASVNAGCAGGANGPLPLTVGPQAKILPSGLGAAPSGAPAAVKLAIAAGNQLISKPYVYGGGHGTPLSQIDSGYDCSGATSYILHGAGAFGLYAEDSTQLESYGQPGPGAWITVYANSGHVFIAVAGIVMNTAWYAPVNPTVPNSGPRWQPASTIPAQYAGDQYGGFVQRHPDGL